MRTAYRREYENCNREGIGSMNFNTQLLHGIGTYDYPYGSTIPPISQAVEYHFESAQKTADVFSHKAMGHAYTRVSNPTLTTLEQRLNELEGGMGAYAVSSGMSAVVLAVLNIVSAGDEIIVGAGAYGGTIEIFKAFSKLGLKLRFVHEVRVEEVEPLINENTKVIFGEMVGNPSLNVIDVAAVAELAHAHNIPLIIDSTTSSPYVVRPIELGADIVVHSTTKYIAGSGQAIGGVIIDSGKFQWDFDRFGGLSDYRKYGKMAYLVRLRTDIGENLGGCMSPMNAYLTILGLETLGLRMDRICSNAQALAEALAEIPGIEVNYPGLPGTRNYELIQSQCRGLAGGLLTFRMGSREKAFAAIDNLKIALKATSLGDVRTLAIHPLSTIYLHSKPEECDAASVYDDTVRVSVGIEDAQDLIDDFKQAIEKALAE